MRSKSLAIIGVWVISNLLASGASIAADNAAEALASARAACGDLDASAVTLVRKDGSWRCSVVETGPVQSDNALTDKNMERFSRLRAVETLTLNGNGHFTETGLSKLADLKGLRRLTLPLHEWKLSDVGAQALSRLKDLEILDLGHCDLSAELSVLKNLPSLRRLKVAVVGSDPKSITAIDGLLKIQRLEDLELSCGDEHGDNLDLFLEDIAHLKALRSLRIPMVDSKRLAAIRGLPLLENLTVSWAMPTDGVADLSVLAKLRSLTIHRVGDEGQGKVRLPPELRSLEIDERVVDRIDLNALPVHLVRLIVSVDPVARNRCNLRKLLDGLPSLQGLTLILGSDRELKELAGLKSLRELSLTGGCGIVTGPGLTAVAGLEGLESLVVEVELRAKSNQVEGMLSRLPKLRRLTLPGPSDSPAWIATVGGLKQLCVLTIWNPRDLPKEHSAMVAERLKAMIDLEELTIRGPVTSELMEGVARLQNLRRLAITGSQVTDERLLQLAGLKELRMIELSYSTGYTDKGLAALMQSLPNLESVTRMYRQPR